MRFQKGRALQWIILLIQAVAAWAGSECQLVAKGIYNDYSDYYDTTTNSSEAFINCTGDSVTFYKGKEDKLPLVTYGKAVIEIDPLYSDNIRLIGAKDVTFTEFVLSKRDFKNDPLFITNCTNCTFRNVAIDSLRFGNVRRILLHIT
ncbi:hypothetical protein Vretifemale_16039, partial [Volvox reticuliferus]